MHFSSCNYKRIYFCTIVATQLFFLLEWKYRNPDPIRVIADYPTCKSNDATLTNAPLLTKELRMFLTENHVNNSGHLCAETNNGLECVSLLRKPLIMNQILHTPKQSPDIEMCSTFCRGLDYFFRNFEQETKHTTIFRYFSAEGCTGIDPFVAPWGSHSEYQIKNVNELVSCTQSTISGANFNFTVILDSWSMDELEAIEGILNTFPHLRIWFLDKTFMESLIAVYTKLISPDSPTRCWMQNQIATRMCRNLRQYASFVYTDRDYYYHESWSIPNFESEYKTYDPLIVVPSIVEEIDKTCITQCKLETKHLSITQVSTFFDKYFKQPDQRTIQIIKRGAQTYLQPLGWQPIHNTCAIIGAAPWLRQYSYGKEIDQHEAVFRSNQHIPDKIPDLLGTKSTYYHLSINIIHEIASGQYQLTPNSTVILYNQQVMDIYKTKILQGTKEDIKYPYYVPPTSVLHFTTSLRRGLKMDIFHTHSGYLMAHEAINLCKHVTLYGYSHADYEIGFHNSFGELMQLWLEEQAGLVTLVLPHPIRCAVGCLASHLNWFGDSI